MIERKVKSVRSLERGIDVLLEIHRSRAASLRELHESTGLPKATLLRMLLTLSKRGLVWQRIADGAFLLDVRAVDDPYAFAISFSDKRA